eukprot:3340266-Rhodomonas_salina.1
MSTFPHTVVLVVLVVVLVVQTRAPLELEGSSGDPASVTCGFQMSGYAYSPMAPIVSLYARWGLHRELWEYCSLQQLL